MISLLLLASSLFFQHCSAKVIVFFPVPGTSHIRYATNVARATTHYGHTPWVCIPDYVAKHNRVDTSGGINVLVYGKKLGDIEAQGASLLKMNETFWNNETRSIRLWVDAMSFFDRTLSELLDGGFINEIKALKPDFFVIDGLPLVKRMYIVPYALGIPYAVVGTLHDVLGYRIPFSPAATPFQLLPVSDQMTFMERLYSAFAYFVLTVLPHFVDPDVVSLHAPDRPHKTLNELVAGAEIYITELDPIMDYPRPTLPNVKLVGGTVVRDAKQLREPFKSFLDKSTKGVILVTFGSMSLVDITRFVFDKVNAACRVAEMNIVWKSEEESPDPQRILTGKWVPQNDILGHDNTKLFISHCGKNGQYESLYHGVPMLCIPVANEQPYNAERIRAKGYGLKADIRFTPTNELSDMVKELVTNSSYKNNMAKASKLFRLFYKSPMNESAFWLDHVMEYGGDYMRAASQKMPYYQFLMLDVLGVLVLIATLGCVSLYTILCYMIRVVCKSQQMKSKSE